MGSVGDFGWGGATTVCIDPTEELAVVILHSSSLPMI